MMGIEQDHFPARETQVGEKCYFCGEPIRLDEDVRYYGGPFLMHAACLNKQVEPHV